MNLEKQPINHALHGDEYRSQLVDRLVCKIVPVLLPLILRTYHFQNFIDLDLETQEERVWLGEKVGQIAYEIATAIEMQAP